MALKQKQYRLPVELAQELEARAAAEDRTETNIVVRAIRRELANPTGDVLREKPRRARAASRAA